MNGEEYRIIDPDGYRRTVPRLPERPPVPPVSGFDGTMTVNHNPGGGVLIMFTDPLNPERRYEMRFDRTAATIFANAILDLIDADEEEEGGR